METPIMMLTTIIVALITAVFGPVAVEWAKNYFGKKKEKPQNAVDEAIQMNALVAEQLEVIQFDRDWETQLLLEQRLLS